MKFENGKYKTELDAFTIEAKDMDVIIYISERTPDKDGNYELTLEISASKEMDIYLPNTSTERTKTVEIHNVSENLILEDLREKIKEDIKNNTSQYVDLESLRNKLKEIEKKYTLSEAQQEYFKDSKLRDDKGHLVPCKHYTSHQFDAFDKNKITEDSYCGRGFYFTSREDFGGTFGHNKVECYINMKKPFILSQIEDKDDFLLYMAQSQEYKNGELPRIEGYPQKSEQYMCHMLDDSLEYHEWEDDLQELVNEVLNSYEYENFKESGNIEDLGSYLDDLKDYDEFREVAAQQGFDDLLDMEMLTHYDLDYYNFHHGTWNDFAPYLTDYAKDNGYDGILLDIHNGACTEIVVFEPNQIKAVENRYPTQNENFRDNREEYMKIHNKPLTLEDKIKAAQEKKQANKHHSNKNKDLEL